jgi:hypothetical protein
MVTSCTRAARAPSPNCQLRNLARMYRKMISSEAKITMTAVRLISSAMVGPTLCELIMYSWPFINSSRLTSSLEYRAEGLHTSEP